MMHIKQRTGTGRSWRRRADAPPAVRQAYDRRRLIGRSVLRPAVFVLGLDPDRLGVRFLQVDNKALGNGGRGCLSGDSVTTTSARVDLPAECRRITAHVDGKLVEIEVEVEKQLERKARFRFVLRRLNAVPEGAISGGDR